MEAELNRKRILREQAQAENARIFAEQNRIAEQNRRAEQTRIYEENQRIIAAENERRIDERNRAKQPVAQPQVAQPQQDASAKRIAELEQKLAALEARQKIDAPKPQIPPSTVESPQEPMRQSEEGIRMGLGHLSRVFWGIVTWVVLFAILVVAGVILIFRLLRGPRVVLPHTPTPQRPGVDYMAKPPGEVKLNLNKMGKWEDV
jgi:hypothetical protein